MPTPPDTRRKLRRIVFATSLGTVFEAYDFILYGSLAALFARQFFSGVNATAAFIFALLTFAAGYLVRPLGALLFGSLGDRRGRRQTFLFTIVLMGLATFGIGLLPTYATAGVLAPIALITLRLLQGLAFGGEYGGAVVFTGEHAPPEQRGYYGGWVQAGAGAGLFLSFFVVYLTRTLVGEAAFEQWGWRLPFLLSLVLLGLSLWTRLSLEESPVFQEMLDEGRAARRPLAEAFGEWPQLKLILLTLFGLMLPQGVIFYTVHFYALYFLTQVLKLPGATMSFIMMLVTLVSVPIYLLVSWLSDRIGRKPLILTGAILSGVLLLPVFHAFAHLVNPGLAAAEARTPVVVTSDPRDCSLQFDPVGQAAFISSCDIAKSQLAGLGISYRNASGSPGTLTVVQVGDSVVQSVDGRGLTDTELELAQQGFNTRLQTILAKEGYVTEVDMTQVNLPLLSALLLLLVLCSTMVYAPAPIMAMELFPTRIRYTGLSLPYHIGSGWFGGFLPAIAFALVASNGSIYIGLWYPLVAIAIGVLVLLFLIPETRGRTLR